MIEINMLRIQGMIGFAIVCALQSNSHSQDVRRMVPIPVVRVAPIPYLSGKEVRRRDPEDIRESLLMLKKIKKATSIPGLLQPRLIFSPVSLSGATDESVDPSYRLIVEAGPAAIPVLCDSLADSSPTSITLTESFGFPPAPFWFGQMREGNPANILEQRALKLGNAFERRVGRPNSSVKAYQIKIGDVAQVALGEIVGRHYRVVDSSDRCISSPTHDVRFRNRLISIWQSESPKQRLLESLVFDFCSRGSPEDHSHESQEWFDAWYAASDYQCRAATRLLYYYPEESTELIVHRLNELQVSANDVEGHAAQLYRNGVDTRHLIHAIAWCRRPALQAALQELASRLDPNDECVRSVLIEHGIGPNAK